MTSTSGRWSRKKRFLLVYLPIALVLYTLFGFFAVPLIIRNIVVPQVQKRLNATIALESAYTNPFTFWLTLKKLEVKDLSGEKVFAFDQFDANFQALDTIFSRGWHFGEITVASPFVKGRIEADGSNTLAKLIKPTPVDPNAKPREPLKVLPRLVVRDLAVRDGTVDFKDFSTPRPFERLINGAHFNIKNVDTRPDVVNPMTIEFSTDDGAKITWTGTLQVNPLTSKGEIEAQGIMASRWTPYAARYTDIDLQGAKVHAKLNYEFAPAASPRIAKVNISSVLVEEPKLIVPWQPLIKGRADAGADKILVSDIKVDADARSISIAKIDVQGGESLLELSKGRSVPQRVADALLSDPRKAAEIAPAPRVERPDVATIPYPIVRLLTGLEQLLTDVQNPWDITLESLEVSGHRHAFADLNAPQPVKLATSEISLHAGPIKSAEQFKTPFTLNAAVQESGKVAINGVIEPLPRKIEGEIDGTGLNATAAAPYIPESALSPLPPAHLGDSILAIKGKFRAELPKEGGARTGWAGRTRFEPLSFESTAGKQVLLGAKSLDVVSDATLDTSTDADIAIRWKGTIKGEGFTAAAPLAQSGDTRALLAGISVDGALNLDRESSGEIKIAYSGSAALSGVEASASDAYGPVSASLSDAAFKGQVAIAAQPGTDPSLTLSGDASSNGIKASAEKLGQVALAVAGFKADALKVDSAAKSLAATLVAVQGLDVKGSPPMLPPEGFTKQPPSGEKRRISLAGLLPINLAIDRFELSGGNIELTDASATPTSPPTVLEAHDISVTAAPVNTSGAAPSDINVAATVNSSGKFALTGTLDAFKESPSANLKVQLSTIPVPPYSGPTGRFLGYQMADGRMTTAIPIQIESEKMKGEIDFAFDHLKLGERVKSQDAIDAPLELGLALLRDSNDQIKSKIPFSGDLTDPKFSLGGVIWQAFTGLLVKAATAPFQILGAIFGAGNQDLSMVAFAPGSAELSPEAISVLDSLAKGMTDRTSISLSVRGQIEPKSDTLELKRQFLREGYAEKLFGKGKIQKLSDQQLKDQTMIAFDQLQVEKAKAENKPAPPSVRRVGSDASPPPPLEEMEAALIEVVQLPPEKIDDLAKRRSQAVIALLTGEKKIDASRVKAAEPAPDKRDAEKPRAVFEVFK
ncbi:MAG: DUF748 domain-containing protein [Phycisphaerales bacterium]|nr:DUF748 domain-containing protein [Planctomycetota bacterium]